MNCSLIDVFPHRGSFLLLVPIRGEIVLHLANDCLKEAKL